MLLTLKVLKLLKSNDFNCLHSKNNSNISVTDDVSKLVKSMDSKFSQ